jgi:phage terminase small subunit
MPRKSAESLTVAPLRVDGKPARLTCRQDAPEAVRAAFARVVASVDASHFAPADAPLIERFAEAIVQAEAAAAALDEAGPVTPDGKVSPWLIVQEKAHRSATALAAKLRLSPVSRMSQDKASKTAARPSWEALSVDWAALRRDSK